MKVLITGTSGLLGHHLISSLPEHTELFLTYAPTDSLTSKHPSKPIDITNRDALETIFSSFQPDIVIHAASQGSVNWCQENPAETAQINLGGTINIIKLCEQYHSRLIFTSSNAIFSGNHPPYSETDLPLPNNTYGLSKLAAEQAMATSSLNYTIIRPTLMYGWPPSGGRDNQVTRVINSLSQNQPLEVVNDIFFNPLPAVSCAQTIWHVIKHNYTGTYNIGGAERASLYDLALHTAATFNLDGSLISSVPASHFPSVAPRAVETTFDTTKMSTELKLAPWTLTQGLHWMKVRAPRHIHAQA